MEIPQITKFGTYAARVDGDLVGRFNFGKGAVKLMVEVLGRDELDWLGATFTVLRNSGWADDNYKQERPVFMVLKGSIASATEATRIEKPDDVQAEDAAGEVGYCKTCGRLDCKFGGLHEARELMRYSAEVEAMEVGE